MIVARDPMVLSTLALPSGDWRVFEAPPGRPWTDDYINMPRALWEGLPTLDGGRSVEECRIWRSPGCPGVPAVEETPAEAAPAAP
jgi:hypothetical protein